MLNPTVQKRPWYRRMVTFFLDAIADKMSNRISDRISDMVCHDNALRLIAVADGANYAVHHMQGALATSDKNVVLLEGLQLAPTTGLFMEFGVWRGSTINRIAERVGKFTKVYGFDSFEGLPEDWQGEYQKGTFHMEGVLPQVHENIELYPGWFDETLPKFVAEHPNTPIAFLHVDCDLYSSAKTIFNCLGERLVPGSIIVFDEYFNYPGWREHEYKAFQELVAERSLRYRYLAYNNREMNTAVQIIE